MAKIFEMRLPVIFIIALTIDVVALSGMDLKASERMDTIPVKCDSISRPTNAENPGILTPYHLDVIKFK